MRRDAPKDIPVAGLPAEFPEPRYIRISCPKCGSKDLMLVEAWVMAIEWVVTDGWMDRASGNKVDGGPTGVTATCKGCRYYWTPRKAPQIECVLESAN